MNSSPKPLLLDILKKLNATQFVSGEDLAEMFQISRANISLTLQQAKTFGVDIQRIHGKGYRLATSIDWLDASQIQSLRQETGSVTVLPVIDSTNTWMLQHPDDFEHGSCLLAECQTQGRGRRGRQWTSSIGGSLTFSLRWDFPFGIARLSGLSLATGVAIARALHRVGLTSAQLKWPNDILIHNKKLAGMLIETQGDALGPIQTIIGIGINVHLTAEQREEIAQSVTDLSEHFTHPPSRNAILAILLDELHSVLKVFTEKGFAAFQSEWESLHAWQNQPVSIMQNTTTILQGIVTGVNADGALVLRTPHGEEIVHAGDVSLRRAS